MAKIIHSAFVIFFFFNLVISIAMAIRDLDPNKNLKRPEEDVKHPETYFYHDRGYLIPGVGRGIKPKSLKGFNPFTYNPITGDNNGIPGLTVPSGHGGGDGSIPGSVGGGGGDGSIPGSVGGGGDGSIPGSVGGGGGDGSIPGSVGGGGGDGSIPGSVGGGSYLPGGDDTLDPNVPVAEAPNPASGDDIPTPDNP